MKVRFNTMVFTGLLVFCLKGNAGAQTFQGHAIRIPGGSNVLVTGVNDSGHMVANYTDAAGSAHCALIVGFTITEIADPNEVGTGPGKGTNCWGINNSGQIAGSYSATTFGNGFVFTGTDYVDIIFPGATAGTIAYGINNFGNVVGSYADNTGQFGFLYTAFSGAYETLAVPGATATLAIGINDNGLITFEWVNSLSVFSGAVLRGGHYSILNVPGALQSKARGVNRRGQIVFNAQDVSGIWHGYVYSQATFTQFDVPTATNTYSFGINTSGVLVGGFNPGGNPSTEVGFEGRLQ